MHPKTHDDGRNIYWPITFSTRIVTIFVTSVFKCRSKGHCFATVSRKSRSMMELIKSLLLSLQLGSLEVADSLALRRFCPLVCCRVTLSQTAAKKGAKSSSEKMLVMVNWGSPSLSPMGLTEPDSDPDFSSKSLATLTT